MSYISWFTKMKGYTDAWLDKATKHGTWTKADQDFYDFSTVAGINPFIKAYELRYKREQHMDRYNFDYGDVTQPWNLPGGSDASLVGDLFRGGLNFVSSNLDDLYHQQKDYEGRRKKRSYDYQDAWH